MQSLSLGFGPSSPYFGICTTVPHSYLFLVAGPAPDGAVAFSQELLAKVDTLPKDAQAVSHLLKQGHLPVPHGNFEAFPAMTKELVVGSSGNLAEFFSNKIRNGGLLDATGNCLVSFYSLLLTRPMPCSQVNLVLLMLCLR